MNDLAKNLLLWVVVAVVLMVVFQSFSPKLAGAGQDVVYSQFVQDVQDDRIKTVDIASDERTVKFVRTDGTPGTTTAPVRDRDLINDLIEHKVEIKQAPRQLLAKIPGLKLVDLSEAELCCGAAGTYNLTEPQMSAELSRRKLKNIVATGARCVVTSNIGCTLQIIREAQQQGQKLTVLHPMELLDCSYRGVTPAM